MAAQALALASIRTDGGTQSRAEINTVCVAEYAADMEAGAEFPPVVVFYDGTDYWLADGFHRVEAVRQLNKKKISADVRQGTVRDAILYSLGANGNHGLRRTIADKRRAVLVLLGDDEWQKKSDRWIAKTCGVSDPFAGRIRGEVLTVSTLNPYRTGQDGKTYPVKPRSCLSPVEDHAEQDDKQEKPQRAESNPTAAAIARASKPDEAIKRADKMLDALLNLLKPAARRIVCERLIERCKSILKS